MTTLDQALLQAQASGLPRLEAQMLLLHALARPTHARAWLLAHGGESLGAAVLADFTHLCQRRLAGEPVAYLSGHKSFYGLDLQVDARVLDPRPDTETLVDWALQWLRPAGPPRQVLDLGCGSGAIALAIASQCPHANVTATDASAAALAVARANAQRLRLPVRFLNAIDSIVEGAVSTPKNGQNDQNDQNDRNGPTRPAAPLPWFDAVAGQRFDLIVSNPPYIAEGDPHLNALRHEPALALISGADGLDAIRAIVAGAPAHLAPGGWLLLEHGHDQADAVRALLAAAGFAPLPSRRDLAGIERCSGGRWLAP